MTFDIKIKHEGRLIQKSKVRAIEDFDIVLDGLKEKFGCKQKPKKRCRN